MCGEHVHKYEKDLGLFPYLKKQFYFSNLEQMGSKNGSKGLLAFNI